MNIQWYPGHMTKAKRMMQEDIKLIDVVIELIDARVPYSSKNPDIDALAANKYRLILLNKTDLADASATAEWENYYKEKGFFVAKINARSGDGMKNISNVVKEACKEKIERDRKRGIINRPLRAMIVGIPNVGKSTFINSYVQRLEISRVLQRESNGYVLEKILNYWIPQEYCGPNLMIKRLDYDLLLSVRSMMRF